MPPRPSAVSPRPRASRADHCRHHLPNMPALFKPRTRFLIITGDIRRRKAEELAAKTLLARLAPTGITRASGYLHCRRAPAKQKIILIDNPNSRQATIRMGIPGYDLANDEISQLPGGPTFSRSIDSASAVTFRPRRASLTASPELHASRHNGSFFTGTETKVRPPCRRWSIFKVLNDMCTDGHAAGTRRIQNRMSPAVS